MQRSVRIVCAPVLSGLDAAIQLPGQPTDHVGGRLAAQLARAAPAPPRPIPPHFLQSIRPALECAFGTEDVAHVPDPIAALVARLGAEPERAESSPAETIPATVQV